MQYFSTVPPTPVTTQINPSIAGTQRAGSGYMQTCIAVKTASGLTRSVQTLWTGPNGDAVVTGGSITVADAMFEPLRTVQTVTFSPLSTIHAGVYSCEATLSSPALTTVYRTMSSYTVTVSGELYMHVYNHPCRHVSIHAVLPFLPL